jgi:xylan 1,4-beta-xylosidase
VAATSSGAATLDSILKNSVRLAPDIDALATSATGEASVLLWNYHDEDVAAPGAAVTVSIRGIPAAVHRVLLHHYRIDDQHSNAYTVWKEMGSPQEPTAGQYATLQAAGQLQLLDSPRWITPEDGKIKLDVQLPRTALSLLRFTWAN